jgi:PAS domain S-box-containing protein
MLEINQNEIFRGMFLDATEGIVVCNRAGELILFNPAALKMFGYNEEEMGRLVIEDLIPSRYRSKHVSHRENYTQSPSPRFMGAGRDLLAITKEKKEFPVEISLSYVNSKSEMLVVAFVIDISERKLKDNELKEANKRLKSAGSELAKLNQELELKVQERTLELAEMIRKLTQSKKEVVLALEKEKELNNLKSTFISTASHEFRTPLATIMSSVSLAGKYAETMDKEKMMKHIERVKTSVNHLTDILNDFLSLDKLEEGVVTANPEKLYLNEFVMQNIEELKGIAKTGQKLLYLGLPNNESVFTDKRILKNILINLISNAIKYSNENTKIEIHANLDFNFLKIEIKDQGIGIPIKDQIHIFERFYRANNSGNVHGTGLGLNIVKKYVEILNGEISFESIPEKGTNFTLKLPI